MEQLRLPPPARDLFRQVYGALDELIRPVSQAGTPGRLGGAMLPERDIFDFAVCGHRCGGF